MDLATLIGFVMGIGLLSWAMFAKEPFSTFADIPSASIVIGGCFASLLISFPLKKVLNLIRVTKNAFFCRNPVGPSPHCRPREVR